MLFGEGLFFYAFMSRERGGAAPRASLRVDEDGDGDGGGAPFVEPNNSKVWVVTARFHLCNEPLNHSHYRTSTTMHLTPV